MWITFIFLDEVVANVTKINTSIKDTPSKSLLGGDGHGQQDHGIVKSTSVTPKIVPSSESNEGSNEKEETRPLTIKERLRYKLLNTKPPYDK